jgi:regulation of enolase protein 1 (concanavalin A-like superfamily)
MSNGNFDEWKDGEPIIDTGDGSFDEWKDGAPVTEEGGGTARITQTSVEVLSEGDPDARISQTSVEVLETGSVSIQDSQVVVEVLATAPQTLTVDFSDYTVDQQPSDWTSRFAVGTNTFTVIPTPSEVEHPTCTQSAYLDKSVAARVLYSWDDIPEHTDIDVISKFHVPLGQANREYYFAVHVRASGSDGNETSYHLVAPAGTNYDLRIRKYIDSASSDVSVAQVKVYDGYAYFVRFQVIGTNLKAKLWRDNQEEPYEWAIETTDSEISSGTWAGLGSFSGPTDYYTDYFSAGLEGASPEFPAGKFSGDTTFGSITPSIGLTDSDPCSVIIGGYYNRRDAIRRLIGAKIYVGSNHSQQRRVAVYSGGSLDDPSGATLLYDFGKTTGSGVTEWLRLEGTDIDVPDDEVLWLALKGDTSGFAKYENYIADVVNSGNFQAARGFYNSSAVSNDEDVAYPATWPSDSGTWDNTAYLLVHAEFDVQYNSFSTSVAATTDVSSIQPSGMTGNIFVSTVAVISATTSPYLHFDFSYSTDFSEYTSSQAPTGWTEQWNPTAFSTQVIDSGITISGPIGSKVVEWTHTANSRGSLSYDASPTNERTQEVLVRAYITTDLLHPFRILVRGSGSSGSETAYYLAIQTSAVTLSKYDGGNSSDLFSSGFDIGFSKSFWVRLRVDNDQIKGKFWSDANIEPYDWSFEETDSSLPTTGWMGFGAYTDASGFEIDYFACSTGNSASPTIPSEDHFSDLAFGANIRKDYLGSALSDFRLMGGYSYESDRSITGARFWKVGTGTGSVRIAIYEGGSLDDPDGATLVVDIGEVSVPATDGVWVSGTCSDTNLPVNTPVWMAIKSNDDSFNYSYQSEPLNSGCFQLVRGRYADSGTSSDETTAFPSTYDGGTGVFSAAWYLFQIILDTRYTGINFATTVAGASDASDIRLRTHQAGDHRYWRLACYGSDSGDIVGAGEIEFRTSIGGSQAATGGTAISGDDYSASYLPVEAFDGNYPGPADWSNAWLARSNQNGWVGYDFGSGNDLEIIEVGLWYRGQTYITELPNHWTLEYSDNGIHWYPSFFVCNPTYEEDELNLFSADSGTGDTLSVGTGLTLPESFSDGDSTGWIFTTGENWSVATTYNGEDAYDNNSLWHITGGDDDAYFTFDLEDIYTTAQIDGGNAHVFITAELFNWGDDTDIGFYRIYFLNSSGVIVGYTESVQTDVYAWTEITIPDYLVPVTARHIRFEYIMYRNSGGTANVAIDAINITLARNDFASLTGGSCLIYAGPSAPLFGEPPDSIDGNQSFYCSMDSTEASYYELEVVDALKRTPVRIGIKINETGKAFGGFDLKASKTGAFSGEEVTLKSQSGISWSSFYEIKEWEFSNEVSYRYFRLYPNDPDTTYYQVNEIYLYDYEDPTYPYVSVGSDQSGSATITASSTYSTNVASNVADGSLSTHWTSSDASAEDWIEFYWAAGKTLNRFDIYSREDYSWEFDGLIIKASDTGDFTGEEDTLLTLSRWEQDWWGISVNKLLRVVFSNLTSYDYYRLYVDRPSATYKGIAEIDSYEGDGVSWEFSTTVAATSDTSDSRLGFYFFNNFNGYTVNTWPVDGTMEWHTGSETTNYFEIVSGGDYGSDGLVLRSKDPGVQQRYGISWDGPGSSLEDIDLLYRVKVGATGSNQWRGASVLRGYGNSSAEEGYFICLEGGRITINNFDGGGYSQPAGTDFTYDTSTWYWIRANITGYDISAKVWADGDAEPGSWTVTWTDTSETHSSGWVGIENDGGATDDFDLFNVGIDGLDAYLDIEFFTDVDAVSDTSDIDLLGIGDKEFDTTAAGISSTSDVDVKLGGFSDAFDDSSIDPNWYQDTGTGGSFSEGTRFLEITSGSGEVHTSVDPTWIYQVVSGDFDVVTRVIIDYDSFQDSFEKVGLLAYVDDTHLCNMSFYTTGQNGLIFRRDDKSGGGVSEGSTVTAYQNNFYLRLTRSGSDFVCRYSLDGGTSWNTASPNTAYTTSETVQIGIFANHPGGTQFVARFEEFTNFTEFSVQTLSLSNDNFGDASLDTDIWTLEGTIGSRSEAGGNLEITSSSLDIYTNTYAPYGVSQLVDGDFDVIIKMDCQGALTQNYEKCGILVELDQDNWGRIGLEYSNGLGVYISHVVSNLSYYDNDSYSADVVYFRVNRVGSTLTYSYSTDNDSYTELAPSTELSTNEQVKIILYASHFSGAQYTALFDYFSQVKTFSTTIAGVSATSDAALKSPGTYTTDFSDSVVDADCVALWKLNDGVLTVDSIGTNTLTNSGMVSSTTIYKEGTGSALGDALGDQLYCNDGNLDSGFPLKSTESNKIISICGWFRCTGLPASDSRHLWGKLDSTGDLRSILVWISNTTKYFTFGIGINTGQSLEYDSIETEIEIDVWYHIGVTFDDSDGSYRLRVWNGDADELFGEITGNFSNNISLRNINFSIGDCNNLDGAGGYRDEVVVFSEVLTADQIDLVRKGGYEGTAAPTRWTKHWHSSNFALSIESGDLGNKRLYYDITGSTRTAASWDDVINAGEEVDIICKVLWTSGGSYNIGPGARLSGGSTDETGYVIWCSEAGNQIILRRYDAGVGSSDLATHSHTLTTSTYYWVRLKIVDDNIKAKIWDDGGSEPGTWDIDYDDTSPIAHSGGAGLVDYSVDGWCDYISIGVDGAEPSYPKYFSTTIAGASATNDIELLGAGDLLFSTAVAGVSSAPNIDLDVPTHRTHDGAIGAYSYDMTSQAAEKTVDGDPDTFWSAKWSPGPAMPNWLQIVFPWKAVVDRIIITADDAFNTRAPGDFTIEVSDTGAFSGEETVLDTQTDITWGVSETKIFTFTNTTAYRYYRIDITDTEDGTYLLVSEVEFWDRSSTELETACASYGSDLTSGETASADTEHSGSFVASNAIDDSTSTAWGSEDVKTSTHWWQVEFASAELINKIRMLAMVAEPRQTPFDFTLVASNTGSFSGEETELLQITGTDGWVASEWRVFEFINHTSYSYYRIEIDDYRNVGSAGITEVELMEGTPYFFTSVSGVSATNDIDLTLYLNLTSDGYAGAQDWYQYPVATYAPEKGVDGSISTLWAGLASSIPNWFSICFPYKAVIDRIVLSARSSPNHNQAPTDFTIEASDTGAFSGEEDTLDTISGISWSSGEVKSFDFSNSTAYSYYRIYITGTDSTATSFTEIEFWNLSNIAPVAAYEAYGSDLTSGETATADSEWSTPANAADKGIDDDTGTLWASDGTRSGSPYHWWQCQFAAPQRINKLILTARSDGGWESQTASHFTLLASNTGSFEGEETEIVQIVNIDSWLSGEERSFEFINGSAYTYYRIDIEDYRSDGGASFTEVEMMSTTTLDATVAAASTTIAADMDFLGSYCWGHVTSVTEENTKTFSSDWAGTGSITGSGDSEAIELDADEYMELEATYTGSENVTISVNSYQSGTGNYYLEYKTSASAAGLSSASWLSYTGLFSSLGYMQLRVFYWDSSVDSLLLEGGGRLVIESIGKLVLESDT